MMEPFYFGTEHKLLFGVYHAPDDRADRGTGVVLCYPMGQEYIRSHRAFLRLAGLLCSRGFHVLRFDFSCCGDSAGDGADVRLERWVDDVSTAVDELRRGGAARTCLIGLRLGAALALISGAKRRDIEAIVAWEPVLNGARFLRELKDLHKRWLHGSFARPRHNHTHPPTSEASGFPLPASLVRELKHLNLLALDRPPADKVLILETRNGGQGRRLHEHLIRLGTESRDEHIPWPDVWTKSEDQDSSGPIPLPILQEIAAWVSEVLP